MDDRLGWEMGERSEMRIGLCGRRRETCATTRLLILLRSIHSLIAIDQE